MSKRAEGLKRASGFGAMVGRGSFIARLFLLYVPTWFVIFVGLAILVVNTDNTFLGTNYVIDIFGGSPSGLGGFMQIIYLGLWAAIIPILVERSNRKMRRSRGWSIYKSVEEDYQRMLKEQELKLEHEAKQNLGIDDSVQGVDKSDIRYWHGLLEDGIISEEEFEKKKAELI